MIAETAKDEKIERETALVNFLQENGGTQTVKQVLAGGLGFDINTLGYAVNSLEHQGKVSYKEGNQKISLVKTNEKNIGICGKCGQEKDLTQKMQRYGEVCEDCYLEKTQIDLPLDEYDLKPGEMTKEQVAEKAGVSLRAVEIWKKEGKLAAEKKRRRVGGVVRKQLIFMKEDVENFLCDQNQPVKMPTVETAELEKAKSEENEFLRASQVFVAENLGKFADAMNNFTTATKQLTTAEPEMEKVNQFLTIKEASDLTRLAQAEIKRLIDDGTLKSYKGSHGETMVSSKQVLDL